MRIAKVIDWFAQKLTPKVIYRPAQNPFLKYEIEKNKHFGFYAAMHLISTAVKNNAAQLKVDVDGYGDPDGEYGDWEVIIRKKEPTHAE